MPYDSVAMVRKAIRRLIHIAARWEAVVSGLVFDRIFDVETRTKVDRRHLDVGEAKRINAWSYEPCSYPRFRRVMDMLPVERTGLIFIDVGSGKGGQLVAAALQGFGKIVGVEFSPALADVARRNVASFARRRPRRATIEVLNLDAMDYPIPPEPCLLFMFNPFREPMMVAFLDALRAQTGTRDQPLYLAYVHPTCQTQVEDSRMFDVVARRLGPTDAVLYRLRTSTPRRQAAQEQG